MLSANLIADSLLLSSTLVTGTLWEDGSIGRLKVERSENLQSFAPEQTSATEERLSQLAQLSRATRKEDVKELEAALSKSKLDEAWQQIKAYFHFRSCCMVVRPCIYSIYRSDAWNFE